MRERVGIKERGYVRVYVEKKRVVIEAVESVADKYYGVVKVKGWPRDLDEFLEEAVKEWLSENMLT